MWECLSWIFIWKGSSMCLRFNPFVWIRGISCKATECLQLILPMVFSTLWGIFFSSHVDLPIWCCFPFFVLQCMCYYFRFLRSIHDISLISSNIVLIAQCQGDLILMNCRNINNLMFPATFSGDVAISASFLLTYKSNHVASQNWLFGSLHYIWPSLYLLIFLVFCLMHSMFILASIYKSITV